jgi:streptogramin lyase
MFTPRLNPARQSLRLESLEHRWLFAGISISDATAIEGDASLRFIDAFVNTESGGGLANAHQLAFGADGSLYVASGDTDSVLQFDGTSGAFLRTVVPTGTQGIDYPWGMTLGPDNKLYVAGRRSDNILRYDPITQQVDTFVADGNGLRGPVGLTFGPDGQLYVANSGRGVGRPDGPGQVLRFAGPSGGPTGEVPGASLGVFVPTGTGAATLRNPNHAAFHENYLYVANSDTDSINRYDATTGAFVDEFTPAQGGGLDSPVYLHFHTDGLLYVASQLSGQVVRFNSAGAFVGVLAAPATDGVIGIAVDPSGLLYVSGRMQVQRHAPRHLASFFVSLDAPAVDPVTVDFVTSEGTAESARDFKANSGTVTFAPGQTIQTILVETINDAAAELDEMFTVELSNPSGALVTDGIGLATISDQDVAGDANGDGIVNLADLNAVRNNFGASGAGVSGDTNGDGQVTLDDLNAVRNKFGAVAGSGTQNHASIQRDPPVAADQALLALRAKENDTPAAMPATSGAIDKSHTAQSLAADHVFGSWFSVGETTAPKRHRRAAVMN